MTGANQSLHRIANAPGELGVRFQHEALSYCYYDVLVL
jgi:hypothetical protein